MDLLFIRFVFILVVAIACFVLRPFALESWEAAGAGAAIGLGVVLFEARLRVVSLKRLIGAVIGSILGIFGAYLFSLVLRDAIEPGRTQHFLQLFEPVVQLANFSQGLFFTAHEVAGIARIPI